MGDLFAKVLRLMLLLEFLGGLKIISNVDFSRHVSFAVFSSGRNHGMSRIVPERPEKFATTIRQETQGKKKNGCRRWRHEKSCRPGSTCR
jgi:hypothetical protein